MPQYRIQIFKAITTGKPWSNVYHCVSDDLTAASAFAETLAAIEQNVHYSFVTILRARVSTEAPDDGIFNTVTLNVAGIRSGSPQTLPLFNTVRVDFGVFGGRPSYKYIRGPLAEDNQDGGTLALGEVSFFGTNYADPLLDLSTTPIADGQLVDEDGNAFTSVSVFGQVQERQRTRRRRKKIVPTP